MKNIKTQNRLLTTLKVIKFISSKRKTEVTFGASRRQTAADAWQKKPLMAEQLLQLLELKVRKAYRSGQQLESNLKQKKRLNLQHIRWVQKQCGDSSIYKWTRTRRQEWLVDQRSLLLWILFSFSLSVLAVAKFSSWKTAGNDHVKERHLSLLFQRLSNQNIEICDLPLITFLFWRRMASVEITISAWTWIISRA